MKFTNFKTIKLATAPSTGDNPPPGVVYEWHSLDGSNNLIINYRLSDGTDKTFAAGTAYELPAASNSTLGGVKIGAGLTITNGVLSAAGNNSAGTVAILTTSQTWTVPAGVTLLKDVWIIAGGGGGAAGHDRYGCGGGGAGGVNHLRDVYVTPASSLTAVIGAAGSAGTVSGTHEGGKGGDSTIAYGGVVYTAVGGGGGSARDIINSTVNGGSGGGGGTGAPDGGTGIASTLGQITIIEGQGNHGGTCSGGIKGGGGGGYSHRGGNYDDASLPGKGGDGIDLRAYVGMSLGDGGWFAAGGGGSFANAITGSQATGGKGGGGAGGATDTSPGAAAMANTGSGGGAGGANVPSGQNGGAGSAGIIIIRY